MRHVLKQKQTLLAAAIGLALALPASAVMAGAETTLLPFPIVPSHHLARQRGGFIGAAGLTLQLNLNLRQMVYVNEQLVSDIKMNLNDLTSATFSDMEAMRAEVQAQRDAIRADANSLAQSIGETVNDITASATVSAPVSAPSSATAAGAGTAVKSASSAMPQSSTQAKGTAGHAVTPTVSATAAPRGGHTPAASSTPRHTSATSAPVSGAARGTTAAPVNSPSNSSTGARAANAASAARTQTAASTRASESAARGVGSNISVAGSSANGTTTTNTVAGPTVTHVTPNNPTLSASGDALERAVVVQNGPNNRVDMDALRDLRGGTMTIIQNTLNNQSFRHVMEVDVTLSGMRNLRTLELLGGLNLQLRGAGK